MVHKLGFREARVLVSSMVEMQYQSLGSARVQVARVGRDLGDEWALFLEVASPQAGLMPVVGAPVLIVSKSGGTVKAAQIPPSFEILYAPKVIDEDE